jgi:predicted dehydrogenase
MEEKSAKKLKILFFGLGSIGKKHAKILNDHFTVELYAYRTKKGQEKNALSIQEFSTLDDAFSIQPDIALITNPTYLHIPTALECAQRNISLFIEKPLSHCLDHLDELEKEIQKRKLFTYVAYNMRFHPVINYLKNIVSTGEQPIYFRVVCSSYLPKWRPEQHYENSYSAQKELGGGVTLDLSHEFDYIVWIFGELQHITGYCGKISNLQINSEDLTEAQITCTQNLRGTLHLNYFSLYNERKIQLYYNTKYIEGDLIQNTVTTIENNKKPQTKKFQNTTNSTYTKQLQYFFEQYHKKNLQNMNNFSEALKTFRKIMEFKKKYCNI